MSTTDEQRLREALERTLGNFRLMLSQKPVRDAAETIAEAERALAQQAPTPAMFEREMLRDGFNRADGTLSHTKDSAHTWGSPSEPAAPVDARERLHRFLNAAAGEGFELDGVDAADLYIELFPEEYARVIASIDPDAAIARQAAAPAEGKS